MKSIIRNIKIVLACVIAAGLGGCIGRTGHDGVDAALYGMYGLVDAKGQRQKQNQKAFEQDLEKQQKSP